MAFSNPTFEQRRAQVLGKTPQQQQQTQPVISSSGYSNPTFEQKRTQIAQQPAQVKKPTVQSSAPKVGTVQTSVYKKVQNDALNRIVSAKNKVVKQVKRIDFDKITNAITKEVKTYASEEGRIRRKEALVAGVKVVPSQIKIGASVIADSIAKQQGSYEDYFNFLPKPFKASSQPKDLLGKLVAPKIEKVTPKIREKATQEQKKAIEPYAKLGEAQTPGQKIAEALMLNLPQIATSTGITVATALITKNPVLAKAVGMSTSYGLGSSEVYTNARQNGLSDKDALPLSMIGGVIIGALDFAPLNRLIGKTGASNKVQQGIVKKIASGIVSAGTQSGFEGITEGLQEIVGNAVQKTYDENAKLFENVGLSSVVGAIFGGFSDVGISAITSGKGKSIEEASGEVSAKIEEAIKTPSDQRSPEQQQIVDSVLTAEVSPDQAIQIVIDQKLDKTDEGKNIVKTVLQAKKEDKDIRIVTSEDNEIQSVEVVDKEYKPTVTETTNINDFLANKLGAKQGGVDRPEHFNLIVDGNRITGNIEEDSTSLSLIQINADKLGTGLGTKIMESMKEYADAKGKSIEVGAVANPKFFSKFPWLTDMKGTTFEYRPGEVVKPSKSFNSLSKFYDDIKDTFKYDTPTMVSRQKPLIDKFRLENPEYKDLIKIDSEGLVKGAELGDLWKRELRKHTITATPLSDKKSEKLDYKPQPGLSDRERAIETKFAEEVSSDLEGAFQRYEKEFGKVINTDNFRELSDDYNENRALNSRAVHEVASAMAKLYYERILAKEDPSGENLILFTAGGTGAGKSTAVKDTPEGKVAWEKSQGIYDTNLNTAESAIQKIDRALELNKRVVIGFIHRDPTDAFVNGVVPRTKRMGRTVPIDTHIQTTIDMQTSIPELMEHYKDHPNVGFIGIDNSHGKHNAKIVNIDSLLGKVYNKDELRGALYDTAKKLFKEGKITTDEYKGYTGENPTESTDKRDRSVNGKKPQQKRVVIGKSPEPTKSFNSKEARVIQEAVSNEFDRINSTANSAEEVVKRMTPAIDNAIIKAKGERYALSGIRTAIKKQMYALAGISEGENYKSAYAQLKVTQEQDPELGEFLGYMERKIAEIDYDLISAKPRKAYKGEKLSKGIKEGENVTQKPIGEGKKKKSRLAVGVEQKAIEKGLIENLSDIPEFKSVNMKDQARLASELLATDRAKAIRVALGQENPPSNLLPESVFTAVENDALADGNIELIKQLATSSRTTEATAMGQRIRALAERNPHSPVNIMRQLVDLRMQSFEKRNKTTFERSVKEQTKVLKVKLSLEERKIRSAQSIIDALTC